ncbi:MAG TPA: DUF3592 domain-containing protein [Gammaproteobacteria bacterium]|jgi:hypothetical protein
MGPKLVGWVFAVIGALCWVFGVYTYTSMRDFAAHAIAVEGTVVELQVQRSSHGITYMPVVEYLDTAGGRHTLYSSTASNPPAFFVAQKVRVLYRPDDPEFPLHARIQSTGQLWGGVIFLGVFGSIFLIIGMAVLLLSWKGREIFYGASWTFSKDIPFGGKRDQDP